MGSINENKKITSFEDLEAWKAARELRKKIAGVIRKFPENEKYRLQDQILRASRSVTSQIAEGFGRYHYKENIQFCRISRGSLFELKDHLTVALDENYINEDEHKEISIDIAKVLKILNGYIKYLKTKTSNNKQPNNLITQ